MIFSVFNNKESRIKNFKEMAVKALDPYSRQQDEGIDGIKEVIRRWREEGNDTCIREASAVFYDMASEYNEFFSKNLAIVDGHVKEKKPSTIFDAVGSDIVEHYTRCIAMISRAVEAFKMEVG